MCFSASASFGASIVLGGAGLIALKKTVNPKMYAFSSTPVLFSLHQLEEGFVWLSLQDPDYSSWYKPALYGYHFISQVVWPLWIPLIIWLMEPDNIRKKWISYFLGLGVATSIYMIYCLAVSDVSAAIESRHIRYALNFPTMDLRRVLYFLTTLVPIFLSSLRYMNLLGSTMLGSLIFSFIFYTQWVISVWCFFAALLSILVIWIIHANKDVNIKA